MYDSDSSTLKTALQGASTAIFTDDTVNKILGLTTSGSDTKISISTVTPDGTGNVTVAAGTEVAFVTTPSSQQTTVIPPSNTPVVIFQGNGGVNATFKDTILGDRLVVGSAGNDSIVLDSRNTRLILGSGNSTVHSGSGADTIVASLGNSTVVGGGHTAIQLSGNAIDYSVTVTADHHALLTKFLIGSTDSLAAPVTAQASTLSMDVSKVQYVQVGTSEALIFAKDTVEAQIATLYHTAFGRDADSGGLNYWFDLARGGATTKQIADAFTHSTEFASKAALSDSDFINSLYQNTFSRAGEATGIAYWQDQLVHGASRADLINSFSQVAAQNIAHTASNAEAQVTGHVTIVQGIV